MKTVISYQEYAHKLEDFWWRRQSTPRFRREFCLMGRAVEVVSNETEVLTAVDHTLPLYTPAPPTDHPPFTIQLVVQPAINPPPPAPDDLMQQITYTGDTGWLMWQLGQWGQAYVDLAAGRATAVLTPQLAQRPELISQCLLHTILLNFMIASGWGLLHASCLVRDDQVLLLLAPHNTGKSTTALRLALSGYALLTDSMVFVDAEGEQVWLLGFPVGKIKLRQDVLGQFGALRPFLSPEIVRQETKYSLDLRQVDGAQVWPTAVSPTHITLCLMSRHDQPETMVRPAEITAVWQAITQNSLYYDTAAVWQQNLAQIERVVARAQAHHLTIGTDEAALLSVIHNL
ncbi:MAG: hypothetical protein H6658_20825 [Ardenticatenaceae bacterium]|nr:hypothetical protein [Ardenticatenaceae bacterium]